MFKIGDAVVYSSSGVARIIDVREEKIRDSHQRCLILETVNGALIKLPLEKAEAGGMRTVTNEEEVPGVIEILRKREMKTDSQTWNRRLRDYQDKIRTGIILNVAEVFRDLTLLKEAKDLSFSERRLLDQAGSLLINELSIAKKTDTSEIERTINQIFSKSTPSASPDMRQS
ncbi:MAG: CarD family transcriptional regulator [Desulfomonilaceae bacterium]